MAGVDMIHGGDRPDGFPDIIFGTFFLFLIVGLIYATLHILMISCPSLCL